MSNEKFKKPELDSKILVRVSLKPCFVDLDIDFEKKNIDFKNSGLKKEIDDVIDHAINKLKKNISDYQCNSPMSVTFEVFLMPVPPGLLPRVEAYIKSRTFKCCDGMLTVQFCCRKSQFQWEIDRRCCDNNSYTDKKSMTFFSTLQKNAECESKPEINQKSEVKHISEPEKPFRDHLSQSSSPSPSSSSGPSLSPRRNSSPSRSSDSFSSDLSVSTFFQSSHKGKGIHFPNFPKFWIKKQKEEIVDIGDVDHPKPISYGH